MLTENIDGILAANRNLHYIFIPNIASEVLSLCDPNYRRIELMRFAEWKKTAGAPCGS